MSLNVGQSAKTQLDNIELASKRIKLEIEANVRRGLWSEKQMHNLLDILYLVGVLKTAVVNLTLDNPSLPQQKLKRP